MFVFCALLIVLISNLISLYPINLLSIQLFPVYHPRQAFKRKLASAFREISWRFWRVNK